MFDVLLHFGTLSAVVIFYRDDFISLFRRLTDGTDMFGIRRIGFGEALRQSEELRLWFFVVVGSVPTVVVALLIQHPVENAFQSPELVASMLVFTGLLLAVTRWTQGNSKGILQTGIGTALLIGLAQGVAIVPGISRSGITITVGMMLGLRGDISAKFSFLLSVPVIIGAVVFEQLGQAGVAGGLDMAVGLAGCGVAFLTGLFALRLVIRAVSSARLYRFSYYCIPLGIVLILYYAT